MSHIKKTTILILALFAALLMIWGQAAATTPTKTLTVGAASGAMDETVSVPITLNDTSGIGGVAFTLTYDAGVLEFKGLEQFGAAITNPDADGNGEPDADYSSVVPTNLFYQENHDTAGRVFVAAASANAISSGNLFNAKFKIIGGDGMYPIGITSTVIKNADAGYGVPASIPVLVGTTTPDNEGNYTSTNFPSYYAGTGVTLVDGSVTVNGIKYAISGKAYYGSTSGAFATGCMVTLMRSSTYGYVFDSSTTVNGSGAFSFSKPAGTYQIYVTSNDPGYYNYQTTPFDVAADYAAGNIVLPAPVRLSGSVTVNGNVLPGLRIKVMNGSTFVGNFSVNSDGSFQTPPLPSATYTLYAIYGNQEKLISTGTNTWNELVLRTISGTISNLTGSATVKVVSATGNMKKTITVSANGPYSITNLVAANDYIVSIAGTGFPVKYYNGTTDYNQATPVDLTSADFTATNFDCAATGYILMTVSGTVTENSSPVVGIGVYAFETTTFALTRAATNDSGAYSITVPLGTYEIFVIKSNNKIFFYKDGGATQSEAEATKFVIENTGTYSGKNIDISEGGYSLTGKVTYKRADGDPAANVLVMAKGTAGWAVALTGADGAYTLSGLNAGEYLVEMNPLNGKFAIQSASVTLPGATVQDFIIDSGNTLSGKIHEEGNEAATISDALVYLSNQETGMLMNGRMYYSNSSGNYAIADIPNCVATLNASHPQYARKKIADLDIMEDKTANVPMSKGDYFIVRVKDGTQKAIEGAVVIVSRTGEISIYGVTDSTGTCKIYGLNADYSDYTIMAQKSGYVRKTETAKTPSATGEPPVDISLLQPDAFFNLSGTITNGCGGSAPAVGARVLVVTKSVGFFASAVTDTSGNYSITGLPQAADYSFMVVIGNNTWVDSVPLNLNGNTDKDATIPCF